MVTYETLEIESQAFTKGQSKDIYKIFKGLYDSALQNCLDEHGSFDLIDITLEFKKIQSSDQSLVTSQKQDNDEFVTPGN